MPLNASIACSTRSSSRTQPVTPFAMTVLKPTAARSLSLAICAGFLELRQAILDRLRIIGHALEAALVQQALRRRSRNRTTAT